MSISKGTWIRTIVLLITLINSILTIFGANPLPFSDEELYEGISAILAVAASLWSWWKNNSFTKAAIKADAYKDKLKAGEQNG